jgi:hypothetical protein
VSPFVVDSSLTEKTFGLAPTDLDVALKAVSPALEKTARDPTDYRPHNERDDMASDVDHYSSTFSRYRMSAQRWAHSQSMNAGRPISGRRKVRPKTLTSTPRVS